MNNAYKTYSVLIRAGKHMLPVCIDVVATSHEAMLADIAEAYFEPDVITWSAR
jgi:hypothetical protein